MEEYHTVLVKTTTINKLLEKQSSAPIKGDFLLVGGDNLEHFGVASVGNEAAENKFGAALVREPVESGLGALGNCPLGARLARSLQKRHPVPVELCFPVGVRCHDRPRRRILRLQAPLHRHETLLLHQVVARVA
jgi:hypothetical protein